MNYYLFLQRNNSPLRCDIKELYQTKLFVSLLEIRVESRIRPQIRQVWIQFRKPYIFVPMTLL